MIQKATLVKCEALEETRFAPYAGDIVFIIDSEYIILNDEVHEDFDIEGNMEIFDITEEFL
jgi:hypothetical protein